MIRFLHVYYPTRTIALLLSEAFIVFGCFLAATWWEIGPDAYIALHYQQGLLKIALITALTLFLSYYFDLYEPRIVSARLQIYFRILLVLGLDCFIVSAILTFDPDVAIGSYVYVLGFALLVPSFLMLRRAYEWIGGQKLFRERVYVLGAGEYARSIVEAIRAHPDIGMEVVFWEDVQVEAARRKQLWVSTLDRLAKSQPPVQRIIVAMEVQRGELPVQELLLMRFQGIEVEEDGTLRERLYGKIQLDGLRPSNFLYSEGFRSAPRSSSPAKLLVCWLPPSGSCCFYPSSHSSLWPSNCPPKAPSSSASRVWAWADASSTSSSSVPCTPMRNPKEQNGPPKTTPGSPASACSCARHGSMRSRNCGTCCAATWAL